VNHFVHVQKRLPLEAEAAGSVQSVVMTSTLPEIGESSRRKRRSPRLAKAVEVRVAGRGESGEVIVEDAETSDISKHGACIVSRSRFPVGSPIAIRRPGGKPMRARVVSIKPGVSEGLLNVGVEFVGEEAAWDLEFPKDWTDYFNRPEDSPISAATDEQRRTITLEDRALEGILRKAQALRASAETMLGEYAAQVEGARRQNTSVLAAQVEEFHAWKSILEGESSNQLEAAKKSLENEREIARQEMELEAATVARRIKEIGAQCQAALKASEELFQQLRVNESQKNVTQVARIAAQLEAQRKAMTVLEEQAAAWRQQSSANVAALEREFQSLMQKATGEMQTAATASVTEFRKKLPGLSQELEAHFSSFLGQQKLAATAWLEQAGKSLRAGTATLEQEHRAALEGSRVRSLDEFSALLSSRLEEFRKASEALAEPMEARAERMRTLLEELAQETDNAVTHARQDLTVAVEKAAAHLREEASARAAQINEAEGAARKRLQQAGEALMTSAHDTHRRVDQVSLDLEALGARLHQQAGKNRQDLEAQFASLLTMYDNRKESLDRLLETLEAGRGTLRDGIELLRVNHQQHQARLQSFTADQEASLRARTAEMEQRLAAAMLRMEAELREHSAAALDSAHQGFIAHIEEAAGESRKRLGETIEHDLQGAANRLPEMLRELDRCLEQHSAALAADLSAHQQSLARTRESFEQQGRETIARLREQREQGEQSIERALTAALAAVEDRQTAACTAVSEQVRAIQQNREASARQHAEQEQMVQRWRQGLEKEFAILSTKLDEKRAALEAFYAAAEQLKSSWVKNIGAIDRRMEDVRALMASTEKQAHASLDKHAGTLGEQLEARLRQSLNSAQNELNAVTDACESLFQARVNDFAQQSLKSTERQVDQGANAAALALDRTMTKERREHERQVEDMGRRFDEQLREQLDNYREGAGSAAAELRQQMQQICRGMLDQVKEAREEMARELPALVTGAEESFRRNLERIQERTLAATSEELRLRASQWKARAEMEMSTPDFEAVAKDH
jgi:hypothetical protein